MQEKHKKWLKIAGIVALALLIYGLFNMKTNLKKSAPARQSVAVLDEESSSKSWGRSNSIDSVAPSAGMEMEAPIADNDTGGSSQEVAQVDKKVIKNGNLSLKIEKTEEAAEKITQTAKNLGGEVFSSSFSERTKGAKSGYMTIKVPSEKFEEAMAEIKKVATQVIDESSNAQDVTEQYVDLQAQLKNKKAEEEAFLKILERSGDIKDVLAVTQQVSRVRGEIERLQARINYMESQTSKATITVSLSEDVTITPINDDWRPWQVVKSSVKQLAKNSQDFIDGLIGFVIVGIPQLLVIALVVWLVIWIGKKVFGKIFKKKPPINPVQ